MKHDKSLKTERHHWWPQTISKHWGNSRGFINRLNAKGESTEVKPKSLAVIKNGHIIKLSDNPEKRSSFDQNFEFFFDKADYNSNVIINLLSEIRIKHFQCESESSTKSNICSSEEHELLIEIIVSLAVRSPMYRDGCIAIAEKIRGEIRALEKDRLIAINMRDALKNITNHIKNEASIYLLLSKEKEFIFGDGFYHDIPTVTIPNRSPTLVCPLTPHICVIIDAKERKKDDSLISVAVNEEEVKICNDTVQVYSKNEIFYREDKPILSEHFKDNIRKEYYHYDNPLLKLLEKIKAQNRSS
ncbi:DUF4238 domain-containing protein [Rahnella sp. FC061912-K]|uniref:DUF4238 domain-containing protein n=1 Tax=Rahnella rivi TaxID=2816249 RepID=UPI001C27962F|nr:DUF4238 domain-containing protein [Rahnella rivi]MBU9829713.1 DUF4238 domain-containing protein [Rahnella rivi]